jgi:hypothetical protein
MRKIIKIVTGLVVAGLILLILFSVLGKKEQEGLNKNSVSVSKKSDFPHLALYIEDPEDLINSGASYDIVYTSQIDEKQAETLRRKNPDLIILYQSPLNYMFDSAVPIIESVTGRKISDNFWLEKRGGGRCGYGMTPEMWAIDIRKQENIETMSLFFSGVLKAFPFYDGAFFDVVEEKSRCDSVRDGEWRRQTTELLKAVRKKVGKKIILTNSGYNYSPSTPYLPYLNGYAMEAFLSGAASYDEGLAAAELVLEKTQSPRFLIFTVYSKNAISKKAVGLNTMRLALTLSLLNDRMYLHYDKGAEEVGNILWQKEFSVDLGKPLGKYYKKDNAYWREFEKGIVVSSPYCRQLPLFKNRGFF